MTDFQLLKNKLLHISLLLLVNICTISAQSLLSGNLFNTNPYAINPAYAGHRGIIAGNINISQTAPSIDGSPKLYGFGLNSPIYRNMSLGGRIYKQSEGLFNFMSIYADYSYSLKLRENQVLRFGLSTGVVSNQINYSGIIADDPSAIIEVAGRNFKGMYFESAAGIVYTWDKLELSFSLPQLFGSKKSFNPDYYTFISYNFNIGQHGLEIKPSLLTRFHAKKPFLYDAQIQATWKKLVFAGIAYRNRPGIIVSTGFNIKELMIAYAMEFGLQKQSTIFNQVHEVSVSYAFKKRTGQIENEPDDPGLPLIVDTGKTKTDTSETKKTPKTNTFYKLTETGKGSYILTQVVQDSTDNEYTDLFLFDQDPDQLIEKDSLFANQILQKLKSDPRFNDLAISEIGEGIYSIKVIETEKDSIASITYKENLENSDKAADEMLEKINNPVKSNKDREHSLDFFSIELMINQANKNILRDAEISVHTWFETDNNGNYSYFYGYFKTEAEARVAMQKLRKYENLPIKLKRLKAKGQ
jgi:type IX secretion system PorP/SprF family membrane protein